MNKTKRAAWHKHLKKAKKHREKPQAQATQAQPAPDDSAPVIP